MVERFDPCIEVDPYVVGDAEASMDGYRFGEYVKYETHLKLQKEFKNFIGVMEQCQDDSISNAAKSVFDSAIKAAKSVDLEEE